MKSACLSLITILSLCFAVHAENRTWTNTAGRSFLGDLQQIDGEDALIRRNFDGIIYRIAISTLSAEDQEYIRLKQTRPEATPAPTPNLLKYGDFEKSTNRWVYRNQEKAFKRIKSNELTQFKNQPHLGEYLIKVESTEFDERGLSGPPYLNQTVEFRKKPDSVQISFDILHLGPTPKNHSIRISAIDPEVRYIHGSGNTFPYTYKTMNQSEEWLHFEWQVDISQLDNDDINFGVMLPHSDGEWFLDNIRVEALN